MPHGWLVALLCALTGAAQAQSLGRLFFTDEERARLDQQRDAPSQDAPRAVGTLRNDGVVRRSSGPATWFVNGAPTDAATLSGLSIRARDRTLTLTGEDGQPLTLKPGEQATLDETGHARPSGTVMDVRQGAPR